MFIGSFKYSVDAKNRVAIPAKMRKYISPEANDTFVMTRGLEKCIDIYPMDVWKDVVVDKLNKLNMFDAQDAMFIRLFLQEAAEDKLDTQSRLIIPKNLLQFSEIDKEVMIIGQMTKIEVWNPDYYESLMTKNQDDFSNIAKEVMKS